MQRMRIVVIGASAGGIEALREVVRALPADFAAPICIVMHSSPQSPGVLGAILARAGQLPAANAREGERLEPGHIYVAPPDCHLLVEPGRARVTKGPRENRFRPAIDPLFRSAAQVYGPDVIGVVLTGNLDDGTAGLWTIKQMGGTTVVQDPKDALYPSMPSSAVQHVRIDHQVPLSDIAPLLVSLTSQAPAMAPEPVTLPSVNVEINIAKEQNPMEAGVQNIGEPSMFACPECHGVLLQLREGGRLRFRCHTGHAYSLDSLVAGINESIEDALWNAIRALEEGDLLMRGVARHMETHGPGRTADLLTRAAESKRHAEAIRRLALAREPLPTEP